MNWGGIAMSGAFILIGLAAPFLADLDIWTAWQKWL
jgi:hypothetical protein